MNQETFKVVYFYLCAAVTVAGALFTVGAQNPIRGAMGLLLAIGGIAALFLSLHAEFLAAVQLIVYAGAVVVLFLFAIMLLGPAAQPPHDRQTFTTRAPAAAGTLVLSAGLIAAILAGNGGPGVAATPGIFPVVRGGEGTIEAMATEVFGRGLVPFELSSALLLVAVVGAVAVARGRQGEPGKASKHMSIATPRVGNSTSNMTEPPPLPGPVGNTHGGHGAGELARTEGR